MTKFLAAFLASGVLLSGVASAATPLNNRSHLGSSANAPNRTPSKPTPSPQPKHKSVNYNASKSNTGNQTFHPPPHGTTQGHLKPGIAFKGSGVPQFTPPTGQSAGKRRHSALMTSPASPTQKP